MTATTTVAANRMIARGMFRRSPKNGKLSLRLSQATEIYYLPHFSSLRSRDIFILKYAFKMNAILFAKQTAILFRGAE
ncbi:MAG: hypothetical protein IJW47_00175 [Clostridia bacterium]|nr:hypothetical protein [Clostridia bacterium]